MEKLKTLELFSGYGTSSFALKQLGVDFECIGYSDIDKYASQCFKQNNGSKELGDVTKINPNDLEDFDLLTGGFPCQTFSVAGKGMGELDSRGTLFNEIIRIAEVKHPRYMMLENVKGLMSKKHKPTFDKIISELYRIGYFVKWKVLNTKEHGIPQNRERVFFCCFKNWNDFIKYEWPEKEELKIFLKDMLEKEVDEKYYLSEKQVTKLKSYLGKKNKINEEVMNCIGTCFGRSGSSSEECESFARTNKALMIGNLSRYKMKSERSMPFKEDGISWGLTGGCDVGVLEPVQLDVSQIRREGKPRVYEKISATLNTAQGGGHTPLILASRGRYNEDGKAEQTLEPNKEGLSNSITSVQKDNYLLQEYRLRKLTPTECFRLQGFLNDEVNLEGLSNTQQYKLAGNGQSVNVVKKIFKQMFALE
jgi:DNA (cytosine-5)-methyltransferase 1